MTRPVVIAIDGPVAAGKTVVGKKLSQKLGYKFVDTGTMYRAVAWMAVVRGVSPEDEEGLACLAGEVSLELSAENGERVLANGEEVTAALRRPEVEERVSLVARLRGVRVAMVQKQRDLAAAGRIVMAGRDIGTVVLPDAALKVFLVASQEERARRRHAELVAVGKAVTYEDVLGSLKLRDRIDSERAESPLRPAADAHLLDTDKLTVCQVLQSILELMED
ncbi:MAG: (d)CMP kinase [Chloroflexi bacterium]|nr:(d)CMP kinase [Chloroflexota bacterium]